MTARCAWVAASEVINALDPLNSSPYNANRLRGLETGSQVQNLSHALAA